MTAEGSDLKLVHQDSSTVFSPQWSPDGDAIYYLRRGSSDELWKVQVADDGSREAPPVRLLSSLSFNVRNQTIPTFSISRDGRHLLYTKRSGYANLWVFRSDRPDESPRQLSTGTSAVRTPRLSPSGERIVFADSVAGRSRLLIVALDGGPVEELAFAEDFVRHPAWSPDGTRVAYATIRSGQALIRTVDVETGLHRDLELEQVAGGDWLAWAPSPSLVYLYATDQNFGIVDVEAGNERPLLSDSPGGWLYEPRASSDGRLLAVFNNVPGAAPDGVWIIDVARGIASHLWDRMVPIGWSADDSIVYAMRQADRRQGGSREIFAIPRSGGQPVLFFTLPLAAEPWNVDIARDGRLIIAALNEFQTDAWIIDNFDPERSGGG
jgi:TolB protein